METKTNLVRRDRAARVLQSYAIATGLNLANEEDAQCALCDLLTDLRHWSAVHGDDFEAASAMSEIHFEEEGD